MKKILLYCGLLTGIASVQATVLLSEPFSYPDGALTTVSGGLWANHSGTAGQLDVASGRAVVTQAESEDVNALLAEGPYAAGDLYASFTINYSLLPAGNGNYFLHFKDATTSGFRARVFATTTGAAEGFYRVGIANTASSTPTTIIPTDLSLGADYHLVVRYDVANASSTLWVNPTSEASTENSVTATDSASALAIHSIALRQSLASGNGMGTLTVDNLQVATTFVEAVPEPGSLALLGAGAALMLVWMRRRNSTQ